MDYRDFYKKSRECHIRCFELYDKYRNSGHYNNNGELTMDKNILKRAENERKKYEIYKRLAEEDMYKIISG